MKPRRLNGAELAALRRRLLDAAGWRCELRHVGKCGGRLELHHRQPYARGGTDADGNLQVLCFHHHRHHAHAGAVTPGAEAWAELIAETPRPRNRAEGSAART